MCGHILVNSLNYLNLNEDPLFLNLATGKGHSVLEIIKEIETQSGIKIPYEFTHRRKGDPSIVISKSKYKISPLNWEPINSNLETIISSVLSIHSIKNCF